MKSSIMSASSLMRTLADLMVDEFTKAETRAWQEHLDAVATAAATARPTASRYETVTNARQPTTELTIATCTPQLNRYASLTVA